MRILIVEDEAVIRKGIIKLLENSHIAITGIEEAKNGEEALAAVSRTKPDLIITDIQMAVMDGLDLIENIRRSHAEIELIVLTGHADFHYIQRALRNQVADYLLKPITQEGLNEVLSKTLLKDPAKWTSRMDNDTIREMSGAAAGLAKDVLAENRGEMRRRLDSWFGFCRGKGYSWTELKRIMGHFELLFRSELYLVLKEYPQDSSLDSQRPAASAHELQSYWEHYLEQLIASVAEKRSPRNKRVVDDAIRQMEAQYGDKELNLQALADRSGVSSAYMSKMFREIMGRPITQYLNELRLEKARLMLLEQPEIKIAAVADECGFNDYPYFSKVFKKHYGISPLEYKEKN
ncbi:response regulator transcription factor [Cohnella fermenti]|uniref:Response regulator n=1 Tax=Cohnella fermenti TaxID=2565925 RepID=A0A4S4C6X2_9BACL|nr:response regulator [Cohnella fermenti]THF83677.1 response regulator [Cohnella fermenti]